MNRLFAKRFCLVAVLWSGLFAPGFAQTPSTPDSTLADAEWEVLKAASGTRSIEVGENPSPDRVSAAHELLRSEYIEYADQLKAFYTNNPAHEGAKEAMGLEALALVRAGRAGDLSQEVRLSELVAEVRMDTEIPIKLRSMAAAGFENLKVRRQTGLSREERLDAFELTVRRLIAEFQDPIGYESLLAIARGRSEESAVKVAEELLEMPAPAAVKRRASFLLQRHAMIGQPVADFLGENDQEVMEAVTKFQGKPLVIFSWATWSSRSIAVAKRLSEELSDEVALIGVNLDRDTAASMALVHAEELKGTYVFDPSGPEGSTVTALALDSAPLVLVVSADGVIESVAAHRELSETIARLSSR